jgi:aminomethyltransferase
MFGRSLRRSFCLKKTSFNDYHTSKLKAAKMINYAGWSMPAFYDGYGINKEHMGCREDAAFFDVSHMGQIKFYGKDRLLFLERIYCNDFAKMKPGDASLTMILNEKAGIIDDNIVSNFGDHHHAVMNAGNTDNDLAHMKKVHEMEFKGKDVRYEFLSNRSLIALQGPKAAEMLQPLLDQDLKKVPFMTIFNAKLKGLNADAIVCRCGYTGEDGFEISVKHEDATRLADYLFSKNKNLAPAGLAARDSLRLEAGLCLHGQEMSTTITPIEAGLMWIVRKKNIAVPFIGQEELNRLREVGLV